MRQFQPNEELLVVCLSRWVGRDILTAGLLPISWALAMGRIRGDEPGSIPMTTLAGTHAERTIAMALRIQSPCCCISTVGVLLGGIAQWHVERNPGQQMDGKGHMICATEQQTRHQSAHANLNHVFGARQWPEIDATQAGLMGHRVVVYPEKRNQVFCLCQVREVNHTLWRAAFRECHVLTAMLTGLRHQVDWP